MRITYRKSTVHSYWNKRWSNISADLAMSNENIYPLKYAIQTVAGKTGLILEAGCGAGRLMRYFKYKGYSIIGIDFIEVAISKLKEVDPNLDVEVGDISKLRFCDEKFQFVFAFGLYHSLEHNLEVAIRETFRVLKKGWESLRLFSG